VSRLAFFCVFQWKKILLFDENPMRLSFSNNYLSKGVMRKEEESSLVNWSNDVETIRSLTLSVQSITHHKEIYCRKLQDVVLWRSRNGWLKPDSVKLVELTWFADKQKNKFCTKQSVECQKCHFLIHMWGMELLQNFAFMYKKKKSESLLFA